MPRPDAPPLTRAVVLRGFGFAIAIALGAVAVWLIVTGTSQMNLRLGALAGFWGIFFGAAAVFGSRRAQHTEAVISVSAELERRSSGSIEPGAQADARRAFEQRLEQLIRSEINSSVSREIGEVRREVAQLRQDLLDKVGGQLRLERIETTRLFGSDLEALQDEVRQLKTARDSSGLGTGRSVFEAAAIPVAAERIDTAHAEQAARERAADEKASRERTEREKAAREKAATERAEREKAEREKAEREKAEREKAATERAAREKAESEKAAAQQAARERAEAEQAARHKEVAAQAARDKELAEQAARQQAAAERAAREKARREQVERQKAAAEKAAREKAAREKVAREKAAREKAAREKAARDKASADESARKQRAEQAAREQAAVEQAARDRVAAERSRASSDPFASLPRITPFTDFELDPVDSPAAVDGTRTDEPSYTGRRRAGGVDVEDAGRHSRHTADASDRGGRRRRDDEDEDGIDLLSQLLSRGSADR